MSDGVDSAGPRTARRLPIAAAVILAVPLVLLVLFVCFPWGLLAGPVAQLAAGAIGRPVTIVSAHRIGAPSLVPTIEFDDVTIGRPAWMPPGAMARIARVRVTFPVLPLLIGRVRPRAIDLAGLRIALFRDAAGRANWTNGPSGKQARPSAFPRLAIADAVYRLIDLRRHVTLAGTIRAAPGGSLIVEGGGTLRGAPLRLRATGGMAAGGMAEGGQGPTPVRLRLSSPLVDLAADAVLDHPFALDAFCAHVTASGRDLRDLDDLVEAGLFPTRAFTLTGDIRRDREAGRDRDLWRVSGLRATAGRSALTAALTIRRAGGRTRLDGRVDAGAFDFADFTSAAQRARGRAKALATGSRLIPDTRVDLSKLARLDGTLRFTAARLLSSPGSPFRSIATTVTLDRRRLRLDPLRVGLVAGRLTGTALDDDRGPMADVTLDLRIAGARVETLILKNGAIDGPLEGRILLRGRGADFRAAMAGASGHVGLSVPSGTVRRDYATFAGGDVLKSVGAAIGGAAGQRVALRCMVGDFRVRAGRMVPAPLVIDNAVSRLDASGSIDLGSERIALLLAGRAKRPGLLRSTAPTRLFGTLSAPRIDIRPPRAAAAGRTGTIARIGFFLKGLRLGQDGPAPAPDADCAGLARAALR